MRSLQDGLHIFVFACPSSRPSAMLGLRPERQSGPPDGQNAVTNSEDSIDTQVFQILTGSIRPSDRGTPRIQSSVERS